MKKYFMQGTADELHDGDMIKLDLTEDLPNGKISHHHIECRFIKPLIPLLLDEGIIEEQETKDTVQNKAEKEILDFCNDEEQDILEAVLKANEKLELRLESLEDIVSNMAKLIRFPSTKAANSVKRRRHEKKAC